MKIKYFFALLSIFALFLNRSFSKISPYGGPVEATMFLGLMFRAKPFLRFCKNYPVLIIIFIYALVVLAKDLLVYGVEFEYFRRAAMFFYAFMPAFFLLYAKEISVLVRRNLLILSLFFFLIIFLNIPGFQPTMAAELAGALFLASILYSRNVLVSLVFLGCFLFSASGLSSGQSLFRTPFVTLFVGLFFLVVFIIYKGFVSKKLVLIFSFCSVILISMIFSPIVGETIGGVLLGLSGLVNSSVLFDLGVALGGDVSSSRGSSAGTTETRAFFWGAIVVHQLSNPMNFLFGNGFSSGFLNVVLPDFSFSNKDLIEPHNSFMGIFFKLGIVGLLLFLKLLKDVVGVCSSYVGFWKLAPFLSIATLFASFEVALENPHGAFIFWGIIFVPVVFELASAENKKIKTGNI
ncbi:hypothetical protein KUV35_05765 [Marinobacter salsuginis]|uniref:hypothetical protein n=1 Tax=Marinobacter salsuginis TaxID=418719 RepID=UPI001C95D8CC|nr:hypothetical protein [Marinobacter salsuginis]MBY6070787.1 hypothetical protein [Marinobacter salsuginis]